MNIKKISIELSNITGNDYYIVENEDDNTLIIQCNNKIRFIKMPKNKDLITAEYILNKIENKYKNLKSIFESLDIKGDIYYTSFGFSYDMFFKSDNDFKNDIKKRAF